MDRPYQTAKLPKKVWDVLYLYSGYDGFYSLVDIAERLSVSKQTVIDRMKKVKKLYPEAYDGFKKSHMMAWRVAKRQRENLQKPWKFGLIYLDDELDEQIKEKFQIVEPRVRTYTNPERIGNDA